MSSFLIFLHAAVAILLMGPVMLATSAFPSAAAKVAKGDTSQESATRLMHRVSTTYGYLSALVPLLGASVLYTDFDAYKSAWQYHTALMLSAIAWILLLVVILPKQQRLAGRLGLLAEGEVDPEDTAIDPVKANKQLSAFSGVFNLLWIIVLVLMYI